MLQGLETHMSSGLADGKGLASQHENPCSAPCREAVKESQSVEGRCSGLSVRDRDANGLSAKKPTIKGTPTKRHQGVGQGMRGCSRSSD